MLPSTLAMQRHVRKQLFALGRQCGEALLDRLYWRGWPATLAYHCGLQPHATLDVCHMTLPSSNAPRPPLRIAFASDVHAGPTTHPAVIHNACAQVRHAQPDLLLLGGDFVSFHDRYLGDLLATIRSIPAPLGAYAVLGNHDYWANHQRVTQQLQAHGITLLTNANQQLPAPYDDIWLCGLDDASDGQPDPVAAFTGAGSHRIVLMHSPEGMRDLEHISFRLAMCGHTHGGQIATPRGRPLSLPTGVCCRRYPGGIYQLPGTEARTLLVSRGIGCSGIPIRLGATPHMFLCIIETVALDQ
jgi:uncharacterized protein